jgi:hypothetical protein
MQYGVAVRLEQLASLLGRARALLDEANVFAHPPDGHPSGS